LIGLIGIPISLITERFLPAPLVTYLDSQLEADLSITDLLAFGLFLPVAAACIWNYIQLYRFKNSARPVAIALTVLGFSLLFFIGPFIESSLSRVLSDVATMIWGATLAMMYCEPFDRLFTDD